MGSVSSNMSRTTDRARARVLLSVILLTAPAPARGAGVVLLYRLPH
jgi:hypothetical protein